MRRVAGHDIVKTLIIVNVAIYVLCVLTARPGVFESPLFQFMALHTPNVMHGQVWRLFTAQYLHWNTGHIFMNMLGLYFLGRPLAMEWGTKQFLAVYTVAGLLGNLFYVALTLVGWLPMVGVAAGASGCVLGLLGAAAVRYPHAEVWVYFLFPIKIRTAALIFAGFYVLNLYTRGENAGGDACHLAGLAFGAWWAVRGE
jgi:membrane associated rhomboid family serine protease